MLMVNHLVTVSRGPEAGIGKGKRVTVNLGNGRHRFAENDAAVEESGNTIEIALKFSGTGKPVESVLDPAVIDPGRYRVEFENAQVRIFRAQVEPHGVIPRHEHTLNRVLVLLTDMAFRVTDDRGNVTVVNNKAGDVVWAAPVIHTEENISDQPFEVVAVELKA